MLEIRRRTFVTFLAGAAAWPLAARAQQDGRVRRIGVLMGFDESDPVSKTTVSALTQALADLGWIDGRSMRTFGGVAVTPIGHEPSRRTARFHCGNHRRGGLSARRAGAAKGAAGGGRSGPFADEVAAIERKEKVA
jgi:hypothetical protein